MDVNSQAFAEALDSFTYLVNADLSELAGQLDPRLIDGLQNGKAQKFEYTLELCWKVIKAFIKQKEGLDEALPKKVAKAYYLAGYLSEDDYLDLLQAIDDRSKLGHIYAKHEFDQIIERLPRYSVLMRHIHGTMQKNACE